MADVTADMVHAQVLEMRTRAAQAPERIELGKSQIAAIEAAHRLAAGTDDIGPLIEFQGLPVVKSRRDDHIRLLVTGDNGEDTEVDGAQPATPSGPDAPAGATQ